MAPASATTASDVAAALRVSVGLLVRRLRQTPAPDGLSLPETSALARLDRTGPSSASAMARREQISPQSMGATLAALESRGLIARTSDPADGRRVVLTITPEGAEVLRTRRDARVQRMAAALADGFSEAELAGLAAAAPLLERLAERL